MADYTHTSAFHTMHVFDTGGMRILRFERNRQSSMCLADPYDTDIEYVRYMHLTLAVTPHATKPSTCVAVRLWTDAIVG